MSENRDSEQVLEGAGAVENGELNGFQPETAPGDAAASAGEVPVIVEPVDGAGRIDQVDQEDGKEGLLHRADSAENSSGDTRATEDGVKEDMFVDCPDELIVSDNREVAEIPESNQRLETQDDLQEAPANESDTGTQINQLMDELVHLRAVLEKTISEKEGSTQEYKAEREAFMKELANLHYQLQTLNSQQVLPRENDSSLVSGLQRAEMEEVGEMISLSDNPLHDMVNECSKFVRNALNVQLQTEETFRGLHSMVFTRDKEIEDLHAKVAELSISQDVVLSSAKSWSDSLKTSLDLTHNEQQRTEAIADRLLASLGISVNEDLLDDSISVKMSRIEKSTSLLIEKHSHFLCEIDILKQSLTEVGLGFSIQDDIGTTIVGAREILLDLQKKEVDLAQRINSLEDENRKLVEQLDEGKETAKMANADVEKLRLELEQEKIKYSNTKEKLSMAVTKGKALVQQRDLLKQSLAEKTSVLEKCLTELQEKSSALEVAEITKEELVRTETLAASLQEALAQRDALFTKCEEILPDATEPQELQSADIVERIRWLVNERNTLMGLKMELHKLINVPSLIDLPENNSSSDLESRVSWLVESLSQAKGEANKLQDEIARTNEAVNNEIEHLTISLLTEMQQKNYLQEELEDLTNKYKEITEKEHQVSIEKDQMVSMLLDVSGIAMDSQEADQTHFDVAMLIERCFEKVKELSSSSSKSSNLQAEMFERIQTLLYIKDQELMLCEALLEEDVLVRSRVNTLLNELGVASEELQALKDVKSALQKDLERSEEKSALIREKLSMAVKKGKGLVQEKDNLKKRLDEKNAEIEKLKLEKQEQESTLDGCKNQISKLSADVELIPKLEADLTTMKDLKDQLEQFLAESNNMLHRVIESIDDIALPNDPTFKEPVEKVHWLGRYFSECQAAKIDVEQELEKLKVEVISLSGKLAETCTTKESLEEALSVAENNISRLAEEKGELEVGKTYVEQELQKVLDQLSSQAGKFSEVSAMRKSLEDALLEAENKISVLVNEKEGAQFSRAAVESELEKVKEEVSIQTTKLTEAYRTIKSLEDALSEAETNVSFLSEEKNHAQADRNNLENEMKKLKEEADSQVSKLAEAYSTIKSLEDALSQLETNVSLLSEANNKVQADRSNLENEMKKLKDEADSQARKLADAGSIITRLEDALLKAENNISELLGEKKNAEEEILALNSKLNACMEELAGASGSLESRSLELSSHLNNLQLLLNDKTLFSLLGERFEIKFEGLKDMDLLLKDIKDHFVKMGSEKLKSYPDTEEDGYILKLLADLENNTKVELDNGEGHAEGGDSFESYFRKTVEGLHSKNKILADKFEGFSVSMEEIIAFLLTKLQAIRNEVVAKLGQVRVLEQTINNLETGRQAHENKRAMLEHGITVLQSACIDATQELQFMVERNVLELGVVPELEKLNNLSSDMREAQGETVAENQLKLEGSKYVKTAEDLLQATRKVQALTKQFENAMNESAITIKNMDNKLKETGISLENAVEERDLNQNRVSKLETDLEVLQNSFQEMKFKLEDYQEKEANLNAREAELLSLYNTSVTKEKGNEDVLLSASEVKSLYDKVDNFEVPFSEFQVEDTEFHDTDRVKKLFYIIDAAAAMRHHVNILSHDKDELQSTVGNLVHQIEHLEETVQEQIRDNHDSEKMKSEFVELELVLENIIQKLGGNNFLGDKKSAGVRELLTVLEKQVMGMILESENSKSKAQELGAKLLESQKIMDELSTKVRLLEHSNQSRSGSPEDAPERSIITETPSVPSWSEITEIEDGGPLGKKATPPLPSAAHVRTLRKGSNDHLAINMDSESDHLITNEETDEDKGHVFKSLNTSGLVPLKGKMIADRIDGLWVSSGRALMSRPRARLGVIAYCLLVHIWILGTIL